MGTAGARAIFVMMHKTPWAIPKGVSVRGGFSHWIWLWRRSDRKSASQGNSARTRCPRRPNSPALLHQASPQQASSTTAWKSIPQSRTHQNHTQTQQHNECTQDASASGINTIHCISHFFHSFPFGCIYYGTRLPSCQVLFLFFFSMGRAYTPLYRLPENIWQCPAFQRTLPHAFGGGWGNWTPVPMNRHFCNATD